MHRIGRHQRDTGMPVLRVVPTEELVAMHPSVLDRAEACRKIRALAPRTGIIMVTVRDAEEDKVRALEAGADDYVCLLYTSRCV